MFLMSAQKHRKVVTEGLAAADAQMAAMKVKLKQIFLQIYIIFRYNKISYICGFTPEPAKNMRPEMLKNLPFLFVYSATAKAPTKKWQLQLVAN